MNNIFKFIHNEFCVSASPPPWLASHASALNGWKPVNNYDVFILCSVIKCTHTHTPTHRTSVRITLWMQTAALMRKSQSAAAWQSSGDHWILHINWVRQTLSCVCATLPPRCNSHRRRRRVSNNVSLSYANWNLQLSWLPAVQFCFPKCSISPSR